jgi:hypothetical protein
MEMEYPLQLLEKEKRRLEKYIKREDLMSKDRQKASRELEKVSQLKKASKLIKEKQYKAYPPSAD